jgi:hypothetical protein
MSPVARAGAPPDARAVRRRVPILASPYALGQPKPPRYTQTDKTSNVYFTQFKASDHQEFALIQAVTQRQNLVDVIRAAAAQKAASKPYDKKAVLRALLGLREATLSVVQEVRLWRVVVGERPFPAAKDNYLLRLRNDLDSLQELHPTETFGFWVGGRNPFALPLRPLRPVLKAGDLDFEEIGLLRSIAEVPDALRLRIAVAHEYLAAEEQRFDASSASKAWAYDKWTTGLAWAGPAPRRLTKRVAKPDAATATQTSDLCEDATAPVPPLKGTTAVLPLKLRAPNARHRPEMD